MGRSITQFMKYTKVKGVNLHEIYILEFLESWWNQRKPVVLIHPKIHERSAIDELRLFQNFQVHH